ncbi:hypothetical protein QWY85_15140 [Neolewinella lacunae]|uniref:Secretion system C-terminal sorting domain-containing protein n=1 Tax=Neolewinella lacunae TaxID=1517758 RepID=A0A923TBM2_9BACT|nr:hypothetical protein [Neolewinella lacunae]MBC6992757.1 hypothetical protein [Neolewinella lacunae]MDN3636001.1 hypothetical protein [Neolewinella lacunae]
MNLRLQLSTLLLLLATATVFGQDSFGPGSRWVYDHYGGFYEGINIVEFEGLTKVGELEFNKFKISQTITRFNEDTIRRERPPIYFKNQDNLILVSFDGMVADTLFDFNAGPGDNWLLSYPNTDVTIRLEVLDTFRHYLNELEVAAQILSYEYSDRGTIIDTVMNYIGNTLGYIDPFELVFSDVETVEGGPPRCLYHPAIGLKEFNDYLIFGYRYDCENILTSTRGIGDVHLDPVDVTAFTAGGVLRVTCENCVNRQYRVFDVTGRMVKSGSLARGTTELGLQGATSGLYFLHIEGHRAHKFIHHANY